MEGVKLEGRKKNNDIKVVSVEHKLGHNASPTCVLSFGEDYGAEAEIIGEAHQGLKAMFTMMNNARLNVGVQGIAIAERAYQKALHFSKNRKQGSSLSSEKKETVDIIKHPDVKRMLLEMKSQIEAMRALAIITGEMIDYHKKFPNTLEGKNNLMMLNLLTPVIKSWCTDQSVSLTSIGIQVHGGMPTSSVYELYKKIRIHASQVRFASHQTNKVNQVKEVLQFNEIHNVTNLTSKSWDM